MRDTRAIYLLRRAIERIDGGPSLIWPIGTYEFRRFTILTFMRDRIHDGGTRVRRGWTVVAWCDIVTRRACRRTRRRFRNGGRRTRMSGCEKKQKKRNEIGSRHPLRFTRRTSRGALCSRSSGTARGRHKFCDRSWWHTAKDFREDRLSIC